MIMGRAVILASLLLIDPLRCFAVTIDLGLILNYTANNPYIDRSGNSNNLSNLTSGISLTSNQRGETNGAIRFSSDSDFVTSTSNIGITGNDVYSYSFWIKFNNPINEENRNVLSFGGNFQSTNGNAASFVINNMAIASWGGWADVGVSNSDILWDNWNHFAFIYDGSLNTSKFFLNGNNLGNIWLGSGNLTSTHSLDDSVLTLGFISNAFTGVGGSAISDVRLYNRDLSEAEVNEIYIIEAPEPSALSLLFVGLGVVLRRRRRTV